MFPADLVTLAEEILFRVVCNEGRNLDHKTD